MLTPVPFVAAWFGLMTASPPPADPPRTEMHLYQARDFNPATLKTDDRVTVTHDARAWSFLPKDGRSPTALLFFPGGGVEPKAYASLARAVAARGFAVYIVDLPGRLAAPEVHRREAIVLGRAILDGGPAAERWVVGGHSMGATIAAKFVSEEPQRFDGLLLVGTTHPRDWDLSGYGGTVMKVYGTEDRVARQAQSEVNKHLLPAQTEWVRIEGGNHAQFGRYGPQLGDGKAAIDREVQERQTVEAISRLLQRVSEAPRQPARTRPS